ncbi:response regulator [Bacteriovorax sp. PP10]|uniref:histidine kinase n=1 Tax=Bacteriovorax antarcticus TaxID=3088717 RepID=A0ABU5VT11_9BACT|nr:response regulator [Bacteriovorax sp. PP10]MEA9356197.1 response regulator [Bacteriovorax sp. PP10]
MKYTIDQNQFKRFTTRTVIIPVVGSFILSAIFVYIIFHLMSVSELVNHSSIIISRGHELRKLTVDAETGVRGYLITGDESFLEPYNNAKEVWEEKFIELENLTSDNPSQSAMVKDIHTRLLQWDRQYALRIIELKSDNKNFEKILPSIEGKRMMDNLRSLFIRVIQVEEGLRTQRNDSTKESVIITLSLVLGGGLLAGVFLAFFTKKQLSSLSEAYSKVIEKQIIQNQILEAQDWIQSGKTGLMEQIRGDLSLEELSAKALKYLCNRLDGKVAAIYNMEFNTLKRIGTYAFSDEALTRQQTIKLGEGLVGQVAVENIVKVIKDVPEDYVTINSGTGSSKPRQIVLFPLTSDDNVKGVLEIGFFSDIPDNVIEYLKICSESIAIALKSAEYRSTLRDLLEESQRQTEELQTQQEELQANNEELEEQTNALRESQLSLEAQQSELEQTNQQLSKQSLELEIQSETVNLKNEELRGTQLNLEQKARELELASQYKSQFLANMSHELRTPLNSTLILSQLLLEDKKNILGEQEKEFVSTILSSSNDLLTLINDILDLSKVEAGKIELEPEELILKDFVLSIERLFKPLSMNKGIELKTEIAKDAPATIFIDRQRLEQIIKNLLSNAIKFTEKGSVTFRIARAANKNSGRVDFAVIDSGIGIAPEQQGIIFDAFKQADGTTSRKYGGTGLGLTISKDLARLLGGDIVVTSEKNKGSTFTLNLPERDDVDHKIVKVQETNHYQAPTRSPVASALSKTEAPPLISKEVKVETSTLPLPFEDDRNKLDGSDLVRLLLVIEDDTNFAKILYDLSHELKFNCVVAQTAEEGIRAAEDFLPQAIILDMHLPDRSGLTVIDHLKMNAKTRHIPIHIVSAQDQANIALQMGAVGYLRKPVSLIDMRNAIAKLEDKLTHSVKRVLVVEDNKVQRESIKELIQDKMVEVVMAENAVKAMEHLKKTIFDCMILDLHLPDMTGYELLEHMTDIDNISHPPVIVYTGKDLSKLEEQNLQKYSQSIIIKGAHSPERLFSEVTLFLHQVENQLSKDRQNMLQKLRDREQIFEGKKILLVDDDVRNIFALSAALESKGAVIETARNGIEAVAKMKENPTIDLILMDIMMPEMDGYEATREIRKDPRFQRLPIIAVTAKAMGDDQEKCREAGANDYLAKPVDLTKLLSLLRVWMPQKGRL